MEHSFSAVLFGASRGLKNPDHVTDLVNPQFLFRASENTKRREVAAHESFRLAGPTGLEPATSRVTGRGSNAFRLLPRVVGLASADNTTVIGGYQYGATPRSFARFASFWSKVAMASYRWGGGDGDDRASARPGSGLGKSSKTRRQGQVLMVCTPEW